MDPFADGKTGDCHQDQAPHDYQAGGGDGDLAVRQPCTGGSHGIGQVVGDEHADFRDQNDGGKQHVQCDKKAGGLVEAELRPLVETSFQRHFTAQVNDDGGGGDIEQKDRAEPEREVRRAQFAGGADPGETQDRENLGEDEVGQGEFLAKLLAVNGNVVFAREKLRRIDVPGRQAIVGVGHSAIIEPVCALGVLG